MKVKKERNKGGRPGYPVEVRFVFWEALRAGADVAGASAAAGMSVDSGRVWHHQKLRRPHE